MVLTREQAVELGKSGVWKDWSDDKVVRVQLYEDRLCIGLSRFHKALENVLGRAVYTHELADRDKLQAEYEGFCSSPTIDEIVGCIPGGPERIIVAVVGEG